MVPAMVAFVRLAVSPGDAPGGPLLGDQLTAAFSHSGFLEDETFAELRTARHREFAEAPVRMPPHAVSAGIALVMMLVSDWSASSW